MKRIKCASCTKTAGLNKTAASGKGVAEQLKRFANVWWRRGKTLSWGKFERAFIINHNDVINLF
jgi:hypothetical protein